MYSSEGLVERFLDAALIPIRNTDRVKYPLTPARLKDYYLDVAAREFLAARDILTRKGWSLEKQARLFRNPSRIMRMSYYLLEGSARLGHEVTHQRALLGYLVALVERLKTSSPLCEDRRNQQRAPEQALRSIAAERCSALDRDASRRVHRLAGALRTYMDAVYLVPHDVGMEMYGPYDDATRRFYVREFFNLRPTALWPETEAVSASEVRVIAGYRPTISVEFDLFNNPYVRAGSYVSDCEVALVKIDNAPASATRVEALTREVLMTVRRAVDVMAQLHDRDKALRYVRCFWLRMAPFLRAAGRSPELPAEVAARLERVETLPPTGSAPTRETLLRNLGLST